VVSEYEPLSTRLTKSAGWVVYNAGSDLGRVVPKEVLALARRLHLRNHLVMRLYAEDAAVPPMPTRRERLLWDLEARMPARLRALIGRLRGLVAVGPLQVLSGRAVKALEDDRILPNRYAGYVVRATLDNGDPMLFQASEVNNFYRRREVRLDYWQWLRDTLRPAGFDLLVVLVPSKYTVYRPFLVDQRPGPGAGADYLDRLEQDLRAAGIPVLNLTPLISAEAARDLRHDRYLYWLDDIHWNARGIALAERSGLPMQDYGWARAAAASFAAEGRLHIVAVGVPPAITAVAPLAWSRSDDGGLEMIGVNELGEPMDFLYATPSALAALTDALARVRGYLALNRMPAAS